MYKKNVENRKRTRPARVSYTRCDSLDVSLDDLEEREREVGISRRSLTSSPSCFLFSYSFFLFTWTVEGCDRRSEGDYRFDNRDPPRPLQPPAFTFILF